MSGSDYTGRFNDQGFRTGKGVQKFSESEACESYFVKGTPNGKTKYKWSDGQTYQGRLCVGQKEGYATQKYPDGQIFHGLFRRNRSFGPGILTYPSGQQDVGMWENNTLLRCCTTQSFLPPLPPIGPLQHRLRTLINEEPPNVAVEKLRKAGGEGCEEYAHLLYCPYVRQPDSLSLDNKTLRTAYMDGMPWGERHRIAAWNNMDHYCKMQMHAFNNRRFQKEIPYMISRVMKNERTMFNQRGIVEENNLEFLWAATQGDYSKVKEFLLKNRIDPDVADGEGNTPIILASAYWHPEVVTLLLDWAADINCVNDDGLSPLIVAMLRYYTKYKTVAAIDDLYFNPVELNPGQDQAKEEQPLVWTGEIDMSLCRTLDSPPVTLSSIAAPPLAHQGKKQKHKIVKIPETVSSRVDLLMKRSVTPSVSRKESSLSREKSYSTVEKEIVREAWVEEPRLPRPYVVFSRLPVNWFRGQPRYRQINKEEELPLPSATRSQDSMIVLEDFDSGNKPLSRAASRRAKKEEDDQYQEKLKNMRSLSDEEAEPLMYATIEVLLRRGANVIINQVTGDMTPLTLAVRAGDLTMIKYLLNKGADPNKPLSDAYGGVAPLHIAAHLTHYPDIGKIIKTLLDAGADPTQRALPDMSFALERPERKDLVMEYINREGYQLQGMQPLHVACSRELENLEDKIIQVSEVELSPMKSAAEERKAIKYLFQKERIEKSEKAKFEQSRLSKMKSAISKLQGRRKKPADESKKSDRPDSRDSALDVRKDRSTQNVGSQIEIKKSARNIAISAKKSEISVLGFPSEQGQPLFQKRGTGKNNKNPVIDKERSGEATGIRKMKEDRYDKVDVRQMKLATGDSNGKAGARKQDLTDGTLGAGGEKSSNARKISDRRKTEPNRGRNEVKKDMEGKEVKFLDPEEQEAKRMRQMTRKKALTTTVKSLIKGGADVNEEVYGQNPLSLAIKHGNEFLLNALLDAGADPNKDLSMGTGSALAAAVSIDNERKRNLKDQKDILRTLLKRGGDISKKLKIKPDDKEGVPIVEFYHRQVDATRKIGYERYTGFNDLERAVHRRQMREHLVKLKRKHTRRRLDKLQKRLQDPNLTLAERHEIIVELRAIIMMSLASSYLGELMASIKICFECGRQLPKGKGVMCMGCKITYCSKLCKKDAVIRNHCGAECDKVAKCLKLGPQIAEEPKPKYCDVKPILRKAVGYILTECREKNVLLTATEIQLHGTDLEENYSFD